MTSVQELYGELWAQESEIKAELQRSLEPRGPDSLYDVFASIGPRPGDVVLDAGCRDASYAVELVRRHGVRAITVDPVPHHVSLARRTVAEAGLEAEIEVLEGEIETLPLAHGSVDWIWCRDVLIHVDLERGLAECARVLRPGGRMLIYVTLATELLEPDEADRLRRGCALVPESLDAGRLERVAEAVGLAVASVDRLHGEWRERLVEDGGWDPRDNLLSLSRLRRRYGELVARYGQTRVDTAEASALWGLYQLLGKLCPTIYVLERTDA